MPQMLIADNASVAEVTTRGVKSPSFRSWAGLCLASFFLAEMHGVTMPFVNAYLMEQGWRFDAIGGIAALAGFVSLAMNSPAGFLVDRMSRRRELMACASILVGCCFGLLPVVPAGYVGIGALLVVAAILNPLFGPLTNAMTLSLAGHPRMNRALGITQGWDHAGNILAALTAM